jgi:very-short-patch-repair endonuclease
MSKTLSIRTQAKAEASDPRTNWGVTGKRLDRLKEMARARRRDPGEAEKLLWSGLKDQKLSGFKFKRHQIVGSAIVDFACPARWLVVEISGPAANAELDALKDRKLVDVGIRVLRFSDEAVLGDADGVLQAILAELEKPFDRKAALRRAANPHPNPSEEGEAQKLQGISLEDSIG